MSALPNETHESLAEARGENASLREFGFEPDRVAAVAKELLGKS